MLRMDEINKIKKDYSVKGLNLNRIANKYSRSWATVNNYVNLTEEKALVRGKRPGRSKKVITPEVTAAINGILNDEDLLRVHKKQRYTGTSLFKILTKTEIYKGSERQLREAFRNIKEQRSKNKSKENESFLELDFPLGRLLQLDHGEAVVELANIRVQGYLFVASIPNSSIRYPQFFLTKAQEAWGEFHQRAFNYFGGIFEKCVYDNDTVLVIPSKKSIDEKKPTSFFIELVKHYGFKYDFCNLESGNEKGAVEGGVGYSRRNFLTGLPKFSTIEELNHHLKDACTEHIETKQYYQNKRPLKELLLEAQKELKPLKEEKIWRQWENLHVDRFQCVRYKDYRYSVPEKYVGSVLKISITATEIEIFDGSEKIITHKRRFFEEDDSLELDHFLEQLLRKPKAMEYAKVLKNLPQQLEDLRFRLRGRFSKKEGDLEFIKILQLRRTASIEDFDCAVQLAISYGGISFDAVSSILKQLQIGETTYQIPDESLPFNLQINIEKDFCLDKYSTLTEEFSFYD